MGPVCQYIAEHLVICGRSKNMNSQSSRTLPPNSRSDMFEQALIKLCGSGYSRGCFFVVATIKVESEADRKHGFYLVAGGRGLKCSSTCNQRGLVEMPSATHGQSEFLEQQKHSTLPFRRHFTDTGVLQPCAFAREAVVTVGYRLPLLTGWSYQNKCGYGE